jgi:hypothetical protein
MPTDDRDRQLDRALARRLPDSRDAACPDPEILAAYHERTLSLEEMAAWKDHIASCSRCQEALQLVEESEKPLAEDWNEQEVEADRGVSGTQALAVAEAQAEPLRARRLTAGAAALRAASEPAPRPAKRGPRLNWRWVAPVGALAAAVIVWIGVREVANQAPKPSAQVALNREAQPASPAPEAEDRARRKEFATKTEPAPTAPRPNKNQELVAGAPRTRAKKAPSEQEKSSERDVRQLEGPNPGAGESDRLVVQDELKKSRVAGGAPARPTPPAAVAGLTANEPARADRLAPLPQANESVAVTAAAAGNTNESDLQRTVRDSKDLMRLAADDHRLIVAPGQKHAWRVGQGGSISGSTDGGKTWEQQDSGVTVDLTSGSATSDKVAWVAGKSGTLLLTSDGGKHWKQIPTPITGDLGGVHAVDETHASIWDVPNRKSFLTSDGGETWKPAANE